MLLALGIQITFFGCGLCLLQAIERALEPGGRNMPGLLFYLFNAVIMLGIGLIAGGIVARLPGAAFLLLTSLFLIGPLNLFYYHTLLYRDSPLPYRVLLHLAPAIAGFACEIAFQSLDTAVKQKLIASLLADPAHSPLAFPLTLASLHITAYAVFIVRVVIADIDIGRSRREFRFIMVVAILLYIGIRVYPEFFSALKREIRKKRYEKSMLARLDTGVIADRLMEMMREEKLYRDSEISLASVAERMKLSPHQLSQLLNERMQTGFWDFVNRFRVEEAGELLRKTPDVSVISVCYRVGFNTKSSFNAAFKKMTGATPREFKSGNTDRRER
jgi:AraC-like DNA-binding protein